MPPTARQLLERVLGAMHGYRVPGALSAHQQAFGPVHVPVLMVAGEDDGCMAAEIFDALADATIFTRGYRIVRVPEAGHFVHHERYALRHMALRQMAMLRRSELLTFSCRPA